MLDTIQISTFNELLGSCLINNYVKYIKNLLTILNQLKVYHWQTTSYSAHKALGKFYEAMPDLVDGLVETYMGRNGIFGEVDKEQEVYMDKDPLAYMKALRSYVDDTRKDLPQDSEIQNLIDGITDLINTTIYKLENLK